MAKEDEELNEALRPMLRGSEEAFRRVYRTLQPALLRYLTFLVGVADAEDVAAETWAQVCRDLRKFTGDADGFRGWVSTIGRHRALDHLRARNRRPVIDLPIKDLPERPNPIDTEAVAMSLITTQEALGLIGRLPREQGEAVLLRAVIGLDAKTAGRVLGKRPGAVRTAAHRGLRTPARELPDRRGREATRKAIARPVTSWRRPTLNE